MRSCRIICWCLVLTLLAGCQSSEPPDVPRSPAFPVKGRLYVGSTVAANARIAFHPLDPQRSQGRCAVAITRKDGSFELTTYKLNDGAPEGDYTVTVTWPSDTMPDDECECLDPLQHDRFHGKYADPRASLLAATVLPQPNEVNLCTPELPKSLPAAKLAGKSVSSR